MVKFNVIVLAALTPVIMAASVDRPLFFASCSRLTNFNMGENGRVAGGNTVPFRSDQMKSVNEIIDAWEKSGDAEPRRLAFILATARRESAGTWKPLREAHRCGSEQCREAAIGRLLIQRAAKKGVAPRANYALPAANGKRYYGRGYIQLTHASGYKAADKFLGTGTTLYDNPDKVMEPDIAATILVRAMLEGWYGSKRPLSYYLSADRQDWINARRNVNPGSPNKEVTAASAQEIYRCLRLKQI